MPPQQRMVTVNQPDFMARLKSSYCSQVLAVMATDLLVDERRNG